MKRSILLLSLAAVASVTGYAQTVDSAITNRLSEPYGVAVEANVYYITDSANDRVVKFSPDTGVFSTVAGFAGRPGSDDNKGVYARFFSPRGLVSVPARGGFVVADYGNHTLRLVTVDGMVTTIAGRAGVPGFELGPTPAQSAHFNFPSALATDAAGNVYIADTKNNAIRKLDLAGTVTTVLTGLSEPEGIAAGDNGDLWIADTRNHTIKRLKAVGGIEVAAGISGQAGAVDSIFGNETQFSNPTALLWIGGASGLLVCDTGNHALRRVYLDPELQGLYSVETYAGTLTQPGSVNGPLLQAKFNRPVGIVKDPIGGFLIADQANNAVRRIQTAPPKPPVQDPAIGYVTFVKDGFGELLSQLVPVGEAVFNNDVIIAIRSETGAQTYYTLSNTPPSSLEDNIPSPSRLNGATPQPYRDGLHPDEVPPSIDRNDIPDVTFKVISTQDGRRPSSVVQARFQFRVGNPIIVGDNAAYFYITNITTDAEMWYTTNGIAPARGVGARATLGQPIQLGRIQAPVVVKVRAFREGFIDSEIISKSFLPEDFEANRISFGFEDGEASSRFVASAGQRFFAPVTLTLLPKQAMYSLQFAVTVTNVNGSPAITPGAVGFASMLEESIGNDLYRRIPAAMFTNFQAVPNGISLPPFYSDLRVTNPAVNLLAVGWLERRGATNLYDTTKQDLITYSIAHDTVFESKNEKVVTGGYSFTVPETAAEGQEYEIQILRPSATSDGIGQDVFIEAATGGSLTSGAINSIKRVTVGEYKYIVGDAGPFRWFNAGDFGDGWLLNNDVMQVFQSAVYYLNQPPAGSDFFNAMDSSNGATNTLASKAFFGDDTDINEIADGDNELNVDDVYVTFRRSLDPSLSWYRRFWRNGSLQSEKADNVARGSADLPGERWTFKAADLPAENFIAGEPSVTFSLGDMVVTPGQSIEASVKARVIGSYPLRVLMLSLTVEPLDGAPALTQAVEFTPVPNLGAPTMTTSQGLNNYAAVWLNSKVTGVAGDTVIGQLKIALPAGASAASAYRVHFDHASGSPNGLALFPKQIQDGLLIFKNRDASSLSDGIPDSWRLRYFGTVSNVLGYATADADGDGVPNWAEYQAGTNPTDIKSHLRVGARNSGAGRPPTLRWPSVPNKKYTVEAAPALTGADWTVLSSGITGTGQEMEFAPDASGNTARFFRVRVSE